MYSLDIKKNKKTIIFQSVVQLLFFYLNLKGKKILFGL